MRGVLSTNRLLRAATQAYKEQIGNGAAESFNITPGFNTSKCVVEVTKVSTGKIVAPEITKGVAGDTQVTIAFGSGDAPAANEYEVVVIGPIV